MKTYGASVWIVIVAEKGDEFSKKVIDEKYQWIWNNLGGGWFEILVTPDRTLLKADWFISPHPNPGSFGTILFSNFFFLVIVVVDNHQNSEEQPHLLGDIFCTLNHTTRNSQLNIVCRIGRTGRRRKLKKKESERLTGFFFFFFGDGNAGKSKCS
jgi:hypothetical protein